MARTVAGSARRRLPKSGSTRTNEPLRGEALRTWLPPTIAGAVFLLLYVLGNLDVIETRPALAIDALLLASIVLYFPMRYAYRLSGPQRVAAFVLALVWIVTVYLPVHRRIYPAARIGTFEIIAGDLPVVLPTAETGSPIDLVIEGHLEPGVQGSTRAARYRLTLTDAVGETYEHAGEFLESWDRQPQGRGEALDQLRKKTTTRVEIENRAGGDISVTEMFIRGRAEPRLTLSLYPGGRVPVWIFAPLAVALIIASTTFDRFTGAARTAASLTIATTAALTTTFAFQSVASPQPSFRELFGASIVGALLGGPLGGLALWLSGARLHGPQRKPNAG